MVTPHPGARLPYAEDNFNFYQSSARMKIEQTFGIWKARWGFFGRSSSLALQNFEEIVHTSFILHNIIIDDPESSIINHAFRGSLLEMSDIQPGDRLEVVLNEIMTPAEINALEDRAEKQRKILTALINEIGKERPPYSEWGRNANLNHRRSRN